MLSQNSTPSKPQQMKPWAKLSAFTHPCDDIILTHSLYYVYFESLPSTIQFSEIQEYGYLSQIYQDLDHRFWIESYASAGTSVGETKLTKGMIKQLEFGDKLYFYNNHGGAVNIVGYYFNPVAPKERGSGSRRTLVTISSLQTVDEENTKDDLMKLDQIAESEALCPCCFKRLSPSETLFPCQHTFCTACATDVQRGSQVCPTCKSQVKMIKSNVLMKGSIHEVKTMDELRPKRKREHHVILCENSQKVILSQQTYVETPVTSSSSAGKRMKTGANMEIYKEQPLSAKNINNGVQQFTWPSGDFYIGDWKNQKREGKGRFMWANGNVYEGTWKNDRREGKGKLLYACGNVYEGDFKNDHEHGRGKLIWANGDTYEGEFAEGFAQGIGRVVYENGETYEGEWKRNKPDGRGIAKYKNGDIYEGEWKDGRADGKGKFFWVRGDVYEGEWKNDERHGQGKLTYANGNEYEGQFKFNNKDGYGKFTWTNGEVYEGWWKFDFREGAGRLMNGETVIYKGEWRKDQMKVHKPNIFKRIFHRGKKNKIHEESPSVVSQP